MDPITMAVLAALASGAAGESTKAIVSHSYQALKELLRRKFAGESKLARAMAELEKTPESDESRRLLISEIAATGASQDREVLEAASTLMKVLQEYTNKQNVASQTVVGNHNVFSTSGNVSVTIKTTSRVRDI